MVARDSEDMLKIPGFLIMPAFMFATTSSSNGNFVVRVMYVVELTIPNDVRKRALAMFADMIMHPEGAGSSINTEHSAANRLHSNTSTKLSDNVDLLPPQC